MAEDKPRYYLVQVLRAVAATAVLLYHASGATRELRPASSLLYDVFDERFALGVPLFFAISGFVLTHAIQRESIARFAVGRVLRIYPAFWIAVVIAVATRWLVSGSTAWSARSWLTLTLLPLGWTPRPLGGVEWTLFYEMFFYAIFALAWMARSQRAVLAFCAGWSVLLVATAIVAPSQYLVDYPIGIGVALSSRNWPFIFGILAYFLHRRVALRHLPWVALLALLTAVAASYSGLPHRKALFVGLSCGAVLTCVGRYSLHRDAPSRSWLVRCGDWSYGLYLLHATVIVTTVHYLARTDLSAPSLFLVLTIVGFGGGCIYGSFESTLYSHLRKRIFACFDRREIAPARAASAEA